MVVAQAAGAPVRSGRVDGEDVAPGVVLTLIVLVDVDER